MELVRSNTTYRFYIKKLFEDFIDCSGLGEEKVETACTEAVNTFLCAVENPEADERITLEPPGTLWVMTCPQKKWLTNHKGEFFVEIFGIYFFL